MISTLATKRVRVVLVNPTREFGQKTGAFVQALRSRIPRAKFVENDALPHFTYDFAHYDVKDYSEGKEKGIFRAHEDFLRGQLLEAEREDQTILLVSGRYHEDTAPLLAASRESMGVDVATICFDQHLDFRGSYFTAGSFLRWLIEQQHMSGQNLYVVGAHQPIDRDLGILPTLRSRFSHLDFSDTGDAFEALVSEFGRPFGWQIYGLLAWDRLVQWGQERGIHRIYTPGEVPVDSVQFLSFDADVSYEDGYFETASALDPFFERIRRNGLVAAHISEMDSPDSNFEAPELADRFAMLYR